MARTYDNRGDFSRKCTTASFDAWACEPFSVPALSLRLEHDGTGQEDAMIKIFSKDLVTASSLGAAALAVVVLMPVSAVADQAALALEQHQIGVEAFNAGDAEAVAEIYAENAVLHDPQSPEPIRGREAIRGSYEQLFRTFPDARVTMLNVHAEGDLIMYEFRFTGTNEGPIATPDGDVPATGQQVEMPMVVFSDVDEEGRFSDTRRYYDTALMMRQLGLGQ
jgi:steroid delta-isomerase-like uncharacterized protein